MPAHSIVAIDGLIDITRERERFGELAALLQRRIELTTDETAANFAFELGRVLARQLRRPVGRLNIFWLRPS